MHGLGLVLKVKKADCVPPAASATVGVRQALIKLCQGKTACSASRPFSERMKCGPAQYHWLTCKGGFVTNMPPDCGSPEHLRQLRARQAADLRRAADQARKQEAAARSRERSAALKAVRARQHAQRLAAQQSAAAEAARQQAEVAEQQAIQAAASAAAATAAKELAERRAGKWRRYLLVGGIAAAALAIVAVGYVVIK